MSREDQVKRFSQAVEYYSKLGYKMIDVPWMVKPWIDDVTRPFYKDAFAVANGKRLIASGEQGFMQLMTDDVMPYGKFMTLTPCFRDDPDDVFGIHRSKFMKLELINSLDPKSDFKTYNLVNEMVNEAIRFFGDILKVESEHGDPRVEKILDSGSFVQQDCYDIVSSELKIELGSYGYRFHENIGAWIFGTGLAEPRLDLVLDRMGRRT